MKDKYSVIKSRYVTEKSSMQEGLQFANSNKYTAKCQTPKYVFLVDMKATKTEIAEAVESIYSTGKKQIKVTKVNTSIIKPRTKRFRGRMGKVKGYKKAVVSLALGHAIDDGV